MYFISILHHTGGETCVIRFQPIPESVNAQGVPQRTLNSDG
jgi:hypothetical protein